MGQERCVDGLGGSPLRLSSRYLNPAPTWLVQTPALLSAVRWCSLLLIPIPQMGEMGLGGGPLTSPETAFHGSPRPGRGGWVGWVFPSAPGEKLRPRKGSPLPEVPRLRQNQGEMSQLPSPKGFSVPLRICSLGEKVKSLTPQAREMAAGLFRFLEHKKLICTRNS